MIRSSIYQLTSKSNALSRLAGNAMGANVSQWNNVRSYSSSTICMSSSGDGAEGEVLLDKRKDGVYVISFNNESKLNPMTVTMGEEFENMMNNLIENDKDIRCAVLTGKGKAFSAGGDLKFLRERTLDSPQNNSKIMRAFYRRFLSIRNLNVPVISAINGPAVGAGFCLALATDIRITNPKAKLGLNFVKIGLHPGMAATHFLPNLVGSQIANQLLLTGDIITGEEAHALGITLLSENPLDDAIKMATKIASNCPEAVQDLTRSLRLRTNENLEKALCREADCQAHSYATTMSEGLDAIIEKREPNW